MDNRIMLIVNPMAGKGQARSCLMDVIQVFSEAGYATTVYSTTYPGQAIEFAEEFGGDYPILACIGGDGTLSEVISGIMLIPEAFRPKIGYIPLGTANDVATSMKLDRHPKQAALDIVTGRPVPLDVGSFGDKYFAYIAAFGAFTQVSYATPQETKRALGHLAYILEGMVSLPKITPYHAVIEHDGGVIEGDFIFGGACNSTSVAGLVKLNPDMVGLDDGLFEVLLVRNPQNIAELGFVVNNILSRNYTNENVIFLHSKRVKFTFDEDVAWTRDGENGGLWRSVTAVNNHKAVQMIVKQ
jgi:YegS/Rv2252/BmrU family lipid kinase